MLNVAFLLSRVDYNDGVASHLELLATELAKTDVRLTMATGLETGQDAAANRRSALTQLFPRWENLASDQLGTRPATARKLRRLLRAQAVSILHVHGLGMLPLARLATIGLPIPIVATYHPSSHGHSMADFRTSLGGREVALYRALTTVTRPDKIIALSSEIEELFRKTFHVGGDVVEKILCGTDTDHFRPPSAAERRAARESLGIADDALVCVLPGRLNLNKGHDVAVSALDRLGTERPGQAVTVIFPGTGAQEQEIRALVAASAKPDRYLFPGFVPDMRAVYWASDVAMLPSRTEGFGIVVAEAMACGCVPVRTPSGGVRDQIIEGETGFAVPFNDPASLARAIGTLADPELRRCMGAKAARYARANFSGHRLGRQTYRLYRGLTGEDGRTAA